MHLLKSMGGAMAAPKSANPPGKSSYFSSLKLEYFIIDVEMTNQSNQMVNKKIKTRRQVPQKGLFLKDLP